MSKRSARLLFAACALALAAIASVSMAQDSPKGGGSVRRPVTPFVESGVVTPRQTGRFNTIMPEICFWRDTSAGTAFGKSGFCPVPSSAAIGSTCRCNSNATGRPDGKWVGKVMLAPKGDGTTQVVH